jgi:putative endonuclease
MSYFVYILWSIRSKRTYVGQTEDIDNRLQRHNAGYIRSTKAYRPWTLVHKELYLTRSEAMKRETWLKSSIGRKWIAEFIKKLEETGLSVPLSETTERDHVAREAPRTKPA